MEVHLKALIMKSKLSLEGRLVVMLWALLGMWCLVGCSSGASRESESGNLPSEITEEKTDISTYENQTGALMSESEIVKGLQLALGDLGEGRIQLELINRSDQPLQVLSYIQAEEKHYDMFTLSLYQEGELARGIALSDMRNVSFQEIVELAPEERIVHELDLQEWCQRKHNGSTPLSPGNYQLRCTYEVAYSPEESTWLGTLVAQTDFTI